jgi:hypothetical protein
MIVAIFSAVFDPLIGNTIDWSHILSPGSSLPLSLEFACIPSGSHSTVSDVIYFSPSPARPSDTQLFGVAYCRSIKQVPMHFILLAQTSLRRGTATRSVAILSTNLASLHSHLATLNQSCNLALSNQEWKDQLISYSSAINQQKGPLPTSIYESVGIASLQVDHPLQYLPTFIREFGTDIFVLFKV